MTTGISLWVINSSRLVKGCLILGAIRLDFSDDLYKVTIIRRKHSQMLRRSREKFVVGTLGSFAAAIMMLKNKNYLKFHQVLMVLSTHAMVLLGIRKKFQWIIMKLWVTLRNRNRIWRGKEPQNKFGYNMFFLQSCFCILCRLLDFLISTWQLKVFR